MTSKQPQNESKNSAKARQERKFNYSPGELNASACVYCKHRITGATCEAFPDGIPAEITLMLSDHLTPFEGDQGIQFEPIEGIEIPSRLQR